VIRRAFLETRAEMRRRIDATEQGRFSRRRESAAPPNAAEPERTVPLLASRQANAVEEGLVTDAAH